MSNPLISKEARKAIQDKIPMTFRIITNTNIIERIFTPIGKSDDGQIVLYSQYKKTYFNAAKEGIQPSTVIEMKKMSGTSTIDNLVVSIVNTLEKNGYTFYTE